MNLGISRTTYQFGWQDGDMSTEFRVLKWQVAIIPS